MGCRGIRRHRKRRLEVSMEGLERITRRPEVMGGKACIRGMRVTVGMIVGQIGAGRSIEQLLADYPYLPRLWEFNQVRRAHLRKAGPLTQNTHTGVHN